MENMQLLIWGIALMVLYLFYSNKMNDENDAREDAIAARAIAANARAIAAREDAIAARAIAIAAREDAADAKARSDAIAARAAKARSDAIAAKTIADAADAKARSDAIADRADTTSGAADAIVTQLKNKARWTCLDMHNAEADHATFITRCTPRDSNKWKLDGKHLVNVGFDKCLTHHEDNVRSTKSTLLDKYVVGRTCSDHPMNNWEYNSVTGQFKNEKSGLCLDVSAAYGKTPAVMRTCTENYAQHWDLI